MRHLYILIAKFLASATVLLAISQIISRLLGVVRDHVIASYFGANGAGIWNLDTYYAAFRVPDLVYNLLIFGVLSAAFVPLLTTKKSPAAENAFASNVLNVLLVGMLVIIGVVCALAEPITKILTPGFNATDIAQSAMLLRIQLIAPLAFTLSAVCGGLAQHFHRFWGLALAPILYNLGIIGGAVLLAPRFGVVGLSFGVAAGAVAHALSQLPSIIRAGFRWRPIFRIKELTELWRIAAPRVLALGCGQLQLVAITFFATLVGAGALSIFNYAINLASLPLGVVGLAVATTSFGRLAKLAKETRAFGELLSRNILSVLFLVVPASAGLFLLRTEVTELILLGGKFTDGDAYFVAESLAILALIAPAWSMIPILNNGFFARKNADTPLLAGITMLAATIAITWGTIGELDAAGLALGFGLATITGASILWWKIANETTLTLGNKPFAILACTIIMLLVITPLQHIWDTHSALMTACKLGVLGALGAGIYFASARWLKLEELIPGKISL